MTYSRTRVLNLPAVLLRRWEEESGMDGSKGSGDLGPQTRRRRGGQPGNRNAVKTGYRSAAAKAERATIRAFVHRARRLCALARAVAACRDARLTREAPAKSDKRMPAPAAPIAKSDERMPRGVAAGSKTDKRIPPTLPPAPESGARNPTLLPAPAHGPPVRSMPRAPIPAGWSAPRSVRYSSAAGRAGGPGRWRSRASPGCRGRAPPAAA